MASNKRKHTRVDHRAAVELTSESSIFPGTSVNVSVSGMQVVVGLPGVVRFDPTYCISYPWL